MKLLIKQFILLTECLAEAYILLLIIWDKNLKLSFLLTIIFALKRILTYSASKKNKWNNALETVFRWQIFSTENATQNTFFEKEEVRDLEVEDFRRKGEVETFTKF